ncbi:GNAT family N-acetyltransferase [Leucobacter aridicollis]|uniref:GNAT family N-acetyltransferase n=1 Tax=Leucobacter aridicollis TaxID=283878 RepID=UPI002168BB16|nr:GNAT family N-acetyltransferase [Leucobacter aridicollis]MCS3428795.1 GNAT superfamily N-acetyltransferase [Leucobacter aridicollis]
MSALTIRAVDPGEREAWQATYRGYRDFYEKEHDPAVFDTVWGWLHDPAHETRGLVAELDGEIVGLAHYRSFARPLAGSTGIYLDDLFTTPAARGMGAGSALIRRLEEIARDEGATLVRWITADSNATARSLYDKVATQTPWVTYDITV